MSDPVAQIRALRAQSNSAIASRDAARVVALMLPDVTVNVAGGPILSGREASRAAFAEQFADRAFRGYVRDAEHIEVGDDAKTALERGRWTGRWHNDAGEHEMQGTYTAEWRFTNAGWFIQSETFVTGKWKPPR